MTSQSIDLRGNYSSAKLDFDWRIQRNLDNGEFVALDISNDNGISWEANALTLQGNIDRENEWVEESLDLTNFIGSEEVLIRFRGTISSSRERVNIDNVNIFATSEMTSNQMKGEGFEVDQNMMKEVIKNFIISLRNNEFKIFENPLSTQIYGDYDKIMNLLNSKIKSVFSENNGIMINLKIVNGDRSNYQANF